MKPSFVAPAVPLEKSLKEQIANTATAGDDEADNATAGGAARGQLDEEDERNLSILGLFPEEKNADDKREYPPASADVQLGAGSTAAAAGSPVPSTKGT